VIPTIDTRVFDGSRDPFAVGMIGEGACALPGLANEFEGYLKLRAGVYLRQMGMLPPDCLASDGTERDAEDARSLHFAVFARAGGGARVVASMRAIQKSAGPLGALPVERLFPEAFAEAPAPGSSVELSRLTSRHEDSDVKAWLTWALFGAALPYAAERGFPPIFAAIRPSLADRLAADGIQVVRIAEPLLIPDYGGVYVAVSIHVDQRVRRAVHGLRAAAGEDTKPGHFTYLQAPGSPPSDITEGRATSARSSDRTAASTRA
jgi:N-acyl-L-homoserine lactone synthetase